MPVIAVGLLSGCATTSEKKQPPKPKNTVLGTRGLIPAPLENPSVKPKKTTDGLSMINDQVDPTIIDAQNNIIADGGQNNVDTIGEPEVIKPAAVKRLTYVTKNGDSFWRVANMYGVSSKNLARVNGLNIKKPLQKGIVLEIPEGGKLRSKAELERERAKYRKSKNKSSKTKSVATKTKSSNTKAGDYKPRARKSMPANGKYTVKSGDNLWLISRDYGVSSNDIRKFNNLKSDSLSIGQVLVLKSSGSSNNNGIKPVEKVEEIKPIPVPVPVKDDSPIKVVGEDNPIKVVGEKKSEVKDVVKKVEEAPKGLDESKYVFTDYTITGGETVDSIADLHMTPASLIKAKNPGIDWNNLKLGQKIIVPITID